MVIWIVNQHANPPWRPGGTRHFALARELVRRGHRAVIIAAGFAHMTHAETVLAPGQTHRLAAAEGVDFLWLRTPPYVRNDLARVGNMAAFAGRLWWETGLDGLPRPDVILGSTPHLLAAWAAEHLARRRGVPFVLEVRDLWPQTFVDLGYLPAGHPVILALEWLERHLYRRARRIITLLPGAADHMTAKGADPARVVWVPNGVDLSLLPPWQPPPGDGPFTVVYAGSHSLSDDLPTALAAAALLADAGVRFRFIGDGPDKARLQQQAAGLGEVVSFEPPVPKAQIYDRLQSADAFLLLTRDSPLYRWGLSMNKLYDYLAVGRPVLFATRSPYDPVAAAGAGLTVPPSDPAALAAALWHLTRLSAAARATMGQRGRAYAARHHDFALLGGRLEQVLQEVAAEGARP